MCRRHHDIFDGTLQLLRNLLGDFLPQGFVDDDQIYANQYGAGNVVIEHDGADEQMIANGSISSGQRFRRGRDVHARSTDPQRTDFGAVRQRRTC